MQGCLVGIDGGGSKTICVVSDLQGQVLGEGRGGTANYLKAGVYWAKNSLRQAITGALQAAGVKAAQVQGLCAGLAGVYRKRDREIMGRVLEEILPVPKTVLESDAFVGLVGATDARPGVIVISGTGSIAFGVNRRNERARAGGWGHLLGDEGSGYDLARLGLIAALRDFDGRGPETSLREKMSRELYLDSIDGVIPMLYGGQLNPSSVASLYPLVLAAAEEGDPLADNILRRAASDLAEATLVVLSRLGERDSAFPVALAGGVFQNSPRLAGYLRQQLADQAPSVQFIQPLHPPEIGALKVAQAAIQGRPAFRE